MGAMETETPIFYAGPMGRSLSAKIPVQRNGAWKEEDDDVGESGTTGREGETTIFTFGRDLSVVRWALR